jgi:L-amino acid N-acyltransferase YncA
MQLQIVTATTAHITTLCALLNDIIRRGGTTALEEELSPEIFDEWFISGKSVVGCFAALSPTGEAIAFQNLSTHYIETPGWVDIGTFASPLHQKTGAGRALFEVSRNHAKAASFTTINAQIRADNVSGLAYYAKMGFVDYAVKQALPLKNGRLVDRICKRYDLT